MKNIMYEYVGVRVETPGEYELRQKFADMKAKEANREEELKLKIELVKLGFVGTINNLREP